MPLKAHRLLLLLGILLLIAQAVVDAALTISSPVAGSLIQRGASVLVIWSGLETNSSTISVTLVEEGSANAFVIRAILGTIPAGVAGSRSVNIPTTLTPGNDYYIRLATSDIPSIAAVQGPLSIISSISSSVVASASSVAPPSSVVPSISSAAPPPSSSASSLSRSETATSSFTSSFTSSATSSPTDASDSSEPSSNRSSPVLSTGVIAGIVVGAVAVAGLVLAGCICIRRQNKEDDQFADHTAAAVFASQANYTKKNPSTPKSPPMAYANHASSPRHQQSQQNGQYYSTGYDDAYYNYNTNSPMYDHHQQQQYAGYGYHPAAALTPQHQMAVYGGYGNESAWDNNQQYYNTPSEHIQQQQPYPPTSAYYQGANREQPDKYQKPHYTSNV